MALKLVDDGGDGAQHLRLPGGRHLRPLVVQQDGVQEGWDEVVQHHSVIVGSGYPVRDELQRLLLHHPHRLDEGLLGDGFPVQLDRRRYIFGHNLKDANSYATVLILNVHPTHDQKWDIHRVILFFQYKTYFVYIQHI